MQSQSSPIYDAFPVDFTLDLNGKVRAKETCVLTAHTRPQRHPRIPRKLKPLAPSIHSIFPRSADRRGSPRSQWPTPFTAAHPFTPAGGRECNCGGREHTTLEQLCDTAVDPSSNPHLRPLHASISRSATKSPSLPPALPLFLSQHDRNFRWSPPPAHCTPPFPCDADARDNPRPPPHQAVASPVPLQRNEWEAVALLPFIDEQRLLSAVKSIDPDTELTPEERERNEQATDLVFAPGDGLGVRAPPRAPVAAAIAAAAAEAAAADAAKAR
eukprot:scaffold7863_cov118-Isochrysis_galbana.AAC.10